MTPKKGNDYFTRANRSPLNVLGSVKVSVKLGGRVIPTTFHVVEHLSQDVILGIQLLQYNGAILDYVNKRLSLYRCR